MKIKSIKKYYDLVILWKRHSKESVYWYAEIEDDLVFLRMNNFPVEPLYTFISKLEILDYDDLPKQWLLEDIDL